VFRAGYSFRAFRGNERYVKREVFDYANAVLFTLAALLPIVSFCAARYPGITAWIVTVLIRLTDPR